MNKIKNTIETIRFGYSPNEFLPIFEDGKLRNRSEFVTYKLKKIVLNHSLV